MNMIPHILRKDLRRHRWEVLLYLPVCAIWTWQLVSPSYFEWLSVREFVPVLLFGL
jgi:hypothetical protein